MPESVDSLPVPALRFVNTWRLALTVQTKEERTLSNPSDQRFLLPKLFSGAQVDREIRLMVHAVSTGSHA